MGFHLCEISYELLKESFGYFFSYTSQECVLLLRFFFVLFILEFSDEVIPFSSSSSMFNIQVLTEIRAETQIWSWAVVGKRFLESIASSIPGTYFMLGSRNLLPSTAFDPTYLVK